MLGVTATILALLTAWNVQHADSPLYPPALYSGVWTILLGALWIAGDALFPITDSTLAVYLAAALVFSGGGQIALSRRITHAFPHLSYLPAVERVQRALNYSIVLFAACFPFYVGYVRDLSAVSGYPTFWRGVRAESLTIAAGSDPFPFRTFFFGNLVTLAILVALIAWWEARDRRSFALLAMALVYTLMSGSTAGAATLLLATVGILCLRRREMDWRAVVAFLVLFAMIFSAASILLEKGQARRDNSIGENARAVTELVELYALGGLVAFDRVVQAPDSVQASWSISRVFLHMANKLGAHFNLPPLHAEYTQVMPRLDTNTYTMYFSYYPDFGFGGTLAIVFLLGWLTTAVYGKALDGSSTAAVFYGLFFAGIVLSGYNENFFLALSLHLRMLLLCGVVYVLAPRFERSEMAEVRELPVRPQPWKESSK